MNEFENNEEFTSEEPSEEKATQNTPQETTEQNTEAESNSAENNTTYHYAYTPANNQNTYYNPNPQQSTQYNPYYTATAPIAEEPKKKNKTILILIIAFCICAVLAIVGLFVAATASSNGTNNSEKTTNSTNPSAQVETEDQEQAPEKTESGEYTARGVVKNVIDSCVGITVYTQATNYSNFYGYGSQKGGNGEVVQSGAGSGVIMLEDKGKTYIITNAHVISDGSKFTVTLNDKTEYDATMVGYDSQTDIGVLSINKTGLKVAKFGNSDQTVQGEQIVAIGCPGGLDFLNSSSVGYVSALARPIQSTIGYNTECIQIDASINPGNSGGGLVNMQGQIIGIKSSKIAATEYEGMGFAIPSNTAIATANSLIKVGYVEGRAKLGITYKSITSYSNANAIVNALNELGFENAAGTMVINEVSADSELSKTDIQPYDMIVAVNGKTMTSTDVMTSVLAKSKPGDKVKLTIARIKNNKMDTFEIECKLIESKG
ncbi:MAG: trypsin-like peptidase domain-containing protein [Eubacterium sp.]|nr:trypsin-like peptidase domain-containing protein [Eubacterium sp.]